MFLKVLIALVFVAMVASLAAGAGFLLKDGGRSRRVLISLKLRVCLAALLLALLLYGFYGGGLGG
ncbi:DUF2909 family protein [Halomonas caseinilytica]|uniref:DUF2909 domain-containing protein n=1 Tax=Halomonas caseinilytica TaxID=438744 RepID=A0A1M6P032_9GAMM|nr:DUF2909 family protein [Halomonas caseinilytica]SEM24391.1 Protein of unknown function [Halomonas caseinilytica]SHK01337.1 Protein of unknown function [Halomonas caseinilytica]